MGAYYGETLRRAAGPDWRIDPKPFGEWMPEAPTESNPIATAVFPFSSLSLLLIAEDSGIWGSNDIARREEGVSLRLVYPPSHEVAAVREVAVGSYEKARRLLDPGEIRPAVEILVRELERRPRNRLLAREVTALCEAAGMPDAAEKLTRRAVEAGNEVPELLVRYADDLSKTDPRKALEYYRKASQTRWVPASALIRMGQAYASSGDRAVADSCWRRAWRSADAREQEEIRKRMGIPKSEK